MSDPGYTLMEGQPSIIPPSFGPKLLFGLIIVVLALVIWMVVVPIVKKGKFAPDIDNLVKQPLVLSWKGRMLQSGNDLSRDSELIPMGCSQS